MTEFVYVLSYNPFSESLTEDQINIFIKSSRDINTWYYPFIGTYIFKSNKALVDLAPIFRQFFAPSPCILTYAGTHLIGGSLPQTVWDWINDVPLPRLPGAG
jgi:hypothetical protein